MLNKRLVTLQSPPEGLLVEKVSFSAYQKGNGRQICGHSKRDLPCDSA